MQLTDIVLFSQRVDVNDNYHERRDCIDQRMILFLKECGYLPIAIPNIIGIVPEYFRKFPSKAIILTGGNSLEKYGGNAPERDKIDNYLIEQSVKNNIPLVGICRGMQSILEYFGEKLVNISGHVANRHFISSLITDKVCFNREVNSFHNQGVYAMSNKDLIPLAKSNDGVLKAVVHKNKPIMGIMWHPEREFPFSNYDVNLFNSFIEQGKIDINGIGE